MAPMHLTSDPVGPRRRTGRCLAIVLAASVTGGTVAQAEAAEQATVQLHLAGRNVEGRPVAWSDARVLLLSRNGYLWQFAPEQARDYRVVSPSFRPFSHSEMRGELQREFGSRFDVSGTGNYLVVHPAGERDRWATRFDELFRSFIHYFTARGMRPTPPEFPLVAVVFPSQAEFVRYVQQTDGTAPRPGIVGLYSPLSNRVFLYDVTHGQPSDVDWHYNASTILHEATHQLAFNTGIHSRMAVPPRWAGEGLAMLFEARGVWDSSRYRDTQDRINQEQLTAFRQYLRGERPEGSLPVFVQNSDRLFATTPRTAYAEAWALTFFLSETEPTKYLQYLSRTASRQPLKHYSGREQLQEFTDVFGTDLKMLEARFLRFLQNL